MLKEILSAHWGTQYTNKLASLNILNLNLNTCTFLNYVCFKIIAAYSKCKENKKHSIRAFPGSL